ncbi:restriction endonuclease [Fodinibius sediminis]|nr:restriction endonuclease [Fodinibius sediminis]
MKVIKASGEQEEYNEAKLRRSLASAGADKDTIDQIARSMGDLLYEGISTQKIYREAFRRLRHSSDRLAGRYRLKEAILELGPTGFPFEKFVSEMLKRLGYTSRTGVIVEGECVSHEIDVIAEKDDKRFMIECKFHNHQGHKSDVKVPLYIQSRFKDLEKKWSSLPGHKDKLHRGWVVTNTRFTQHALQYGKCVRLKLLSWDYPRHEGLKDLISRVNLHPITCLSSLGKKEKQELLKRDVVFCMQLSEDEQVLSHLNIDALKKVRVREEARDICNANQQNNG